MCDFWASLPQVWLIPGDTHGILYLDFSKAFNKVPHPRLLKKVRVHGMDEKVLVWMGSWLCDKQKRIIIKGCKSELE